jgi:hypothetical protein
MSIVDWQEEFNHKTSLFSVVQKDFFSIPIAIRTISISTFLFVLGWGLGADTFFSLYLQSIVPNVFWISLIAALIPLIKMFFAVTIGTLDDHTNVRSVVFLSKGIYFVTGILFFVAGITHSVPILLLAVVCNAISSAMLFVSYESLIRKYSSIGNKAKAFGLYFSFMNLAYVL